MENLRLRTILAVIGLLVIGIWLVPNFINTEGKSWLPSQKLNYGLDIQGGLHLVMGVDVDGVVSESTTRLAAVLKAELEKEGVAGVQAKASKPAEGEIEITVDASTKEKASGLLEERYSTMLQKITESGNTMTYRYLEAYLMDYKSKVIGQSIETIRNRIDEFGVAEPSISQQGADRILVQLPGMADAEKAKALINTAAKLDFMMVADDKMPTDLQKMIDDAEKAGGYSIKDLKYSEYIAKLNADLKPKLPQGTLVYFEKSENATNMEAGRIPYLLYAETNLGGGDLDDAQVSYNEYGRPEVSLRFNSVGGNKFKVLTGANINKRMAIVLDRVVKTAPVIQTQIGDGRAVITLGGQTDPQKSMDEAKMISTSLRAGALPATLEQLEERRIGPTLGADSVKSAIMASWVAALAILSFMLIRYKGMGIVSDVVLALNVASVLALLTSLGATLTLPGIAGIALTIGFAVDANVLINERMREELRAGSGVNMAIKEGYAKAMSAIIDSNMMVGATAVVLLYFGTGPVKGFAVTLLIGIVTTLFTNVFISKVLVDNLVHKFGIKKLSI